MQISKVVSAIDDFVWGPVMLTFLLGTGIFLTIRLKFRPWRNLGYALKSTLSEEARTTTRGTGDVSPFRTDHGFGGHHWNGNIVGVATAMASGGRERWCGCGFRHVLVFHRNSASVCLPLNTVRSMKKGKCQEALCIHEERVSE